MRGLHFIASLVALSLCAAPAQAKTDEAPWELAPSSGWVMDYADDSCALRRAFRGGEHQVILELRQFAPGEGFQVMVVSDTLSRTAKQPKVRFEPDSVWFEPRSAVYARYRGDREGVVYRHSLLPNSMTPGTALDSWPESDRDARERAITALLVTNTFSRDVLLQTGELHEPMKAMRVCLDELLTHWGIDAAAHRTLSRRAKPVDMEGLVNEIYRNWPTDMAMDGRSGAVQVRLIVGPDGKPTSCHVQLEMTHPQFEESTCKQLMWNARFEPALDAAGAPIASYYTTAVIYQVY